MYMPYYTPQEILTGARGLIRSAFTAPQPFHEQRLELCKNCPFSCYDEESQRCDPSRTKGGCGCYLPSKVKLEDHHCPHGVW